jgi:hypothetical protein
MFNLNNRIWQIALAVIALIYCSIEAQGSGDFYIFMRAAGDLDGETNIFTKVYMDGFHYYYSILFALILKLFYHLPFFGVKLVWLVFNLALYVHLLILLERSSLVSLLNKNQKQLFLILVFLFSFRYLHQNIHVSQITIFMLWCCVYGLCLIQNKKPITGGTLLALGINIKLLPIVFLPYLLYRGYFKGFAVSISVYALSMILPYFIIGQQYYLFLLKSWFDLINPTNQSHILDVDERSFHGLSTLLSTLLVKNVPDPLAMEITRNILDVSLQTLSLTLMTIRLCLIAFTLYFLKWPPFKKAVSTYKGTVEVAYILLLIPLIFPHQQHYAYLFSVPAYAVVLYYTVLNFHNFSKMTKRIIVFLLSLIYLSANLSVLLGEFNHYYEHFKILTYGALLLIPLLIWSSQKRALLRSSQQSNMTHT